MATRPDNTTPPSKGYFHQYTGVPFGVMISGGGAAHLAEKQRIDRAILQSRSDLGKQLVIQHDVQEQLKQKVELVKAISERSDALNTAQQEDAARKAELIEKLSARAKWGVTPNVNNLPDVVMSKIPVFGQILTAWGLITGVKKTAEESVGIWQANKSIEARSPLIEETRNAKNQAESGLAELLQFEQANLNIVNNLVEANRSQMQKSSEM